jgi:hypothetical protein
LSLFCRHNRHTADCPICSKGTVLESASATATRAKPAKRPKASAATKAPAFSGPHADVGPYEHDDVRYLVRLEKVPGGVRLAEWAGSQLRRRAPVLAAADLPGLVRGTAGVLAERDATTLIEALEGEGDGVSPGRSGDFKEELRAEDVGDGRIRVARWVLRPGSGWELQDAPVMVPAARLAEALRGVVSSR